MWHVKFREGSNMLKSTNGLASIMGVHNHLKKPQHRIKISDLLYDSHFGRSPPSWKMAAILKIGGFCQFQFIKYHYSRHNAVYTLPLVCKVATSKEGYGRTAILFFRHSTKNT